MRFLTIIIYKNKTLRQNGSLIFKLLSYRIILNGPEGKIVYLVFQKKKNLPTNLTLEPSKMSINVIFQDGG